MLQERVGGCRGGYEAARTESILSSDVASSYYLHKSDVVNGLWVRAQAGFHHVGSNLARIAKDLLLPESGYCPR